MKIWIERPFEYRNLFNPAFCGVVIIRALQAFEDEDQKGMPFSLALLILPLCLHSESRQIILDNPRTYFLNIINDHPKMLVEFASRAQSLHLYTLEGLGLAMQHQSLKVTNDGRLKIKKRGIRTKFSGTQESIDCQKAARIVGRQFGRIGDRVTIYATLGVKP